MSYIAILFCVNPSNGQSFTISRPVDTLDKQDIYTYLKSEGKVNDDSIDQILLLANGESGSNLYEDPPSILHMWRAENGDFIEWQTKIFSTDETFAHIRSGDMSLSEVDNEGQIIIHTGLYKWTDHTIRDAPDPNYQG